MLYEEFTRRWKNLCLALGFSTQCIRDSQYGADDEYGADNHVPEISWRWTGKEEAVILLSCRAPYNPNWGGYCGHPQMLVQAQNHEEENSPAAFIAPYLRQYRYAQEHVFLGMNGRGEHFITVPANLLERNGGCGRQLIIEPAKVAQPDKDGNIVPAGIAGPMRTFDLSDVLRRDLESLNFAWQPGRSIPIGRYLGSELFTFVDAGANEDGLFETTLLPHLREIVAHQTPSLRAAEIHLDRIFAGAVAAIDADYNRHKVLCLAGLDIDMSTLIGHTEHCFVPWKAYLAKRGEALFLEQDELVVRLMQEEEKPQEILSHACLA